MKEQIDYYKNKLAFEIDSWDLHVAMKEDQDITVIDARSEEAYEQEHIPGAINIPHRLMDEATTGNMKKSSLIVTYCDGIGCNASTKAALNMTNLGFQVKELLGGLDWWKRDEHPTTPTAPGSKTSSCGCNG
jgi:rhodanese-related sulfurtransferase